MIIYTIGHSTRPVHELIAMLRHFNVQLLADVRTIPRSRHNPQYNSTELEASLRQAGLDYKHMPGLGGLRRPRKDSPNGGWRNDAFRGYADYMLTSEFEEALRALIDVLAQRTTSVMCAEAVHWRCHRSVLSDALLVRGIQVLHIQSAGRVAEHKLTPFASVQGTRILYPPEQPSLDLQ